MQTGAIIRSRQGASPLPHSMNRSMSQNITKNKNRTKKINALTQQINSSIYHHLKVFPHDTNPTWLQQIRFFREVEAGPLACPQTALCWVLRESGREREIRSFEDAPHYPPVGLGEHSEEVSTPGSRHLALSLSATTTRCRASPCQTQTRAVGCSCAGQEEAASCYSPRMQSEHAVG